MLAPKISLRQLLLFMVFVAFYLALASLAYRGNVVALGLSVSIAGLVFVFFAYAVSYWLLFGFAKLFGTGKSRWNRSKGLQQAEEVSS